MNRTNDPIWRCAKCFKLHNELPCVVGRLHFCRRCYSQRIRPEQIGNELAAMGTALNRLIEASPENLSPHLDAIVRTIKTLQLVVAAIDRHNGTKTYTRASDVCHASRVPLYSPEERQRIYDLRDQGMAARDIAQALNLPGQSVAALLNQRGRKSRVK